MTSKNYHSEKQPLTHSAALESATMVNLNATDLVYEAMSVAALIPQIDDLASPLEKNGMHILADFIEAKLHAAMEMMGDQKDALVAMKGNDAAEFGNSRIDARNAA
jgi:hypothetical protein